jgi:hypothetical protein
MDHKPKVLVVYYTQSGQMEQIVKRFVEPMIAACEVSYLRLEPKIPYPFPWSAFTFFDGFPDTFNQRVIELMPIPDYLAQRYDLVVLGYQPWFLSPSPVMSSFLQSSFASSVLRDTPIVTVIGCRNMWLTGQEKVKAHLHRLGASLVGNIALVDHAPNVVSLFTILRWLLWGRKEAGRILPAAGVADTDIAGSTKYGQLVLEAMTYHKWQELQSSLNDAGAVDVLPNLVMMEQRGQRAFGIWSAFIRGSAQGTLARRIRVYLFMVLLPTVVLLLTPLLAIITFLALRLRKTQLAQEVAYYRQNTYRGQ